MPLLNSIEFLALILPTRGYYIATILAPVKKQIICATIAELASTIEYHDGLKHTVYHACASFRENRRERPRAHDNIAYVRSLFIDVDCGPGKPYHDAASGARAVLSFCSATALPRPLFVKSGAGIHVYWPLAEELTLEQWEPYARGLKQLCTTHGLHADAVRTADGASILRTPGTHNRKNGEVLVELEAYAPARYSIRDMQAIRPVQRERTQTNIAGAGPDLFELAPIIADCGQIRRFSETGNLSEPVWRLCVGIVARCKDGPEIAHTYSAKDYPNYDPDVTQDRIDRSLQLPGPFTCQEFHKVNPEICEGCSLYGKIKTPLNIGESSPKFASLPDLPKPFKWSAKGEMLCEFDDHGKASYDIVTPHPVFLHAVQTAELDRGSFSYRFALLLPHEERRDIIIDAKTVHSSSGISELFGKGCVIEDNAKFLHYVRTHVAAYHDQTNTQTKYDQFGWKNGASSFLYGRYLYTPAGPVTAIGAKELEENQKWIGPRDGGSLIAWSEAADKFFASDMEAQSCYILASCAAPFMIFQSEMEGGAIIHLSTPQSGKGKTAALLASASFWGDMAGLQLTNEDTRVSKPIRLGMLGNLPVFYDELYSKDPEIIKQFILMFTVGRDRLRGQIDGTIRHVKARWQTVLLSNANLSLLETLATTATDATAYRVLELACGLGKIADLTQGERLLRSLQANAGHAGHAYISYLVVPGVVDWAKQALEMWTKEIYAQTKLDNAHRFRVRLAAAIAVAAVITNKLDILHFNPERIVNYLIKELTRGDHMGATSSIPALQRAQHIAGEFLDEHQAYRIELPGGWKPGAPAQHPSHVSRDRIVMRVETNTKRVFVAKEALKAWCTLRQISMKDVIYQLLANKIIITERPITLTSGTGIPGFQTMCLEFDMTHPAMGGMAVKLLENTG
jgi:Domain of unknown function (DUF927)